MATTTSMITKIQGLLGKINQVTNENDTNLIDAIDTLIEKYNEVSVIVEAVAGELGSINNPINYNGNLILQANKYYFQEGDIYLCNKSSEGNVYHPLTELVGSYVQRIE